MGLLDPLHKAYVGMGRFFTQPKQPQPKQSRQQLNNIARTGGTLGGGIDAIEKLRGGR